MSELSISIDDIRGVGSFIPPGRYLCKLAAATGTTAKGSGKPMVTAVFEIVAGEFEGMEITDYYSMTIKPPKKAGGRNFAPGLAKIRDDLRAVGAPLPDHFRFPQVDAETGNEHKAALILGKHLGGKTVEILMFQTPRKDRETKEVLKDEQGNTLYDVRPRILGKAVSPNEAVPFTNVEDVL